MSGVKNLITHTKQECIPVGCVPPTAVAMCWGGSVCFSACWDTPLGQDTHLLGVGLETPPGVGLETPWQTPQLPPWVWAWRPPPPARPLNFPWVWAWRRPPVRPLNLPPWCGPGDPPPPPWTEFLTDASENITLPQLRCGR